MSSTSQQIDDARKAAEKMKAGEWSSSDASRKLNKADQEPSSDDQARVHSQDLKRYAAEENVDLFAKIGSMNPESAQPSDRTGMQPVQREIAVPVGTEGGHTVAEYFGTKLVRERTEIPEDELTTAQKRTRITTDDVERAEGMDQVLTDKEKENVVVASSSSTDKGKGKAKAKPDNEVSSSSDKGKDKPVKETKTKTVVTSSSSTDKGKKTAKPDKKE